jgi:hypothetical protein
VLGTQGRAIALTGRVLGTDQLCAPIRSMQEQGSGPRTRTSGASAGGHALTVLGRRAATVDRQGGYPFADDRCVRCR